jgi:hypothetical protein
VLFSITNWKEEYIKRFKAVSLVKFLDRMAEEYEHVAEQMGVSEGVSEKKAVVK